MKIFKIPVIFQMWGVCHVEAETLDEAKEKVFEPGLNLPDGAHYLDDSLEIDEDSCILGDTV